MLVIAFREAEYLVNTRYGYLPIRIGTHLFWGWSGVGGQGAVLSKYELMFYESSTPLISYCGVIDGWPLVPPPPPPPPQKKKKSSRDAIAMAKNVYAISFYVVV